MMEVGLELELIFWLLLSRLIEKCWKGVDLKQSNPTWICWRELNNQQKSFMNREEQFLKITFVCTAIRFYFSKNTTIIDKYLLNICYMMNWHKDELDSWHSRRCCSSIHGTPCFSTLEGLVSKTETTALEEVTSPTVVPVGPVLTGGGGVTGHPTEPPWSCSDHLVE